MSRIVTGSPSISSRISSKSARCRGSSVGERLLLLLVVAGQDQVLDELASLAEEHVLGAAQPDPLGAEAPGADRRPPGVSALVRTSSRRLASACSMSRATASTSSSSRAASSPSNQRTTRESCTGHLALEHLAGGPVDRDEVALLDHGPVRGRELAVPHVDVEGVGAAHAGAAHASRDDGGVRGLAAAGGEDACGRDHAVQVVGRGLAADQDDLLAVLGPLHGGGRVEDRLADGRAR